jgi:hypothetical protein
MPKKKSEFVDDILKGLCLAALIVSLVLCSSSCSAIIPNTSAALEALPEDALEPLWMLFEGLILDIINLIF